MVFPTSVVCVSHTAYKCYKGENYKLNDVYNLPTDIQGAMEAVPFRREFFACLWLISLKKKQKML